MTQEIKNLLKSLRVPAADSHKGQNGRLLIIGGSHLFHAASLWSLTVASRIVDLVHYASVEENNQLVHELKKEFRNGIVVPRAEVEDYIKEDDCILIGPGMTRDEETETLTNTLLKKYPEKQWVIDAGSLQMLDLNNIPKHAILTPHHQEFELVLKRAESNDLLSVAQPNSRVLRSFPLASARVQAPSAKNPNLSARPSVHGEDGKNFVFSLRDTVEFFSKQYNCIVLLKGKEDIASNGNETQIIEGGNAGMTKGGTGDVLAGLIAALSCMNDPWTATLAGSAINKQAGDDLFASVGPFFNATDLANQIPKTMKQLMNTRLATR